MTSGANSRKRASRRGRADAIDHAPTPAKGSQKRINGVPKACASITGRSRASVVWNTDWFIAAWEYAPDATVKLPTVSDDG